MTQTWFEHLSAPPTATEAEAIVAWRRALHAEPELSLCEVDTQRYVREALHAQGWQPVAVGGTGLAVVAGRGTAPALLLRADMDALPVQEQTGLPFASRRPGHMHACGHDAHMACLLGVAARLRSLEDQLPGRVVVAFQPGEENGRGAVAMIDDGLLDGRWCGDPTLRVAAALGMHVWSGLPVGHVSATAGPVMANVDDFKITVRGRGGHGALPHQAVDAVVAAAAVVQALQAMVSRGNDPMQPLVVTVGSIHGGSAFNVIAEQVELRGTCRSFGRDLADQLPNWLRATAVRAAGAYGAQADCEYTRYTIALHNDAAMADLVARSAAAAPGVDHVDRSLRMMAGEDFAYFAEQVPACFFFVGCGSPGRSSEPHHSPRFVVDEAALPIAVALMGRATAAWLSR
ncbi:MAG: amidohydrolase [Deltaproteobacteria bacterium]|nr:amidohydrolase [Deltaproteobacteria bacterium]